ncbi:SRPBCC family protein [Candidatus Phycosocius bacilliformis]|nr:SRPBCC family protein [Candidatus Phycosocius bacilliformis]
MMVKLVIGVIVGLACVAGLTLLIGFLLPASRTGQHDRVIDVSPAALSAVILDRASQPQWRADLAKVDIKSATQWTETTERGEVIAFELTSKEANRITMRFASSYGYHGQWEGRLNPTPSGGTHIFVTEQATTPAPIGRILARLFFNPDAFARQYLDALAAETQRRQTGETR